MKISNYGTRCVLLLSFVLFISACGKDGEDGSAYINYSWDIYVDSYSDNNPQTPNTITIDEEYRVNPGSYYFDYQCSDGLGNYWEYSGSYSVSVVKGKKGKGFRDGADGRDRLYDMTLTGTGYFSSYGPRYAEPVKEIKSSLKESRPFPNAERRPVGEEQTHVFQSGNLEIVVSKQCYQLIMK